jgi:DUF1365 family protein
VSASAIYEGGVRHRRHQPIEHAFRYRVFMVYLDLAELPAVFDCHPLWSARRPAAAWFRRADYLGDPATPLGQAVRDLVERRTGERPPGPVRLLTSLRYMGYCFNPVSFYYCFDPAGADVTHVVAEVTNTPWGERHAYVSSGLASRHRKALRVSPFLEMGLEYDWTLTMPGERLEVSIAAGRDGTPLFDATLALRRREISRATLTRLLARYPPMTIKTAAAIYGQALRLRLKGVRTHPHVGTSPG